MVSTVRDPSALPQNLCSRRTPSRRSFTDLVPRRQKHRPSSLRPWPARHQTEEFAFDPSEALGQSGLMIRTLGAFSAAALLLLVSACSSETPSPAAEASCLSAGASHQGFGVSGYTTTPVTPDFYASTARTLVDLDDPAVDSDGALISQMTHGRGPGYHPVALAQYGLAALGSFQLTGDPEYLRRAEATAHKLLDGATATDDGALWFAYPFEHSLHGDESMTLSAPWYSGMAQGQGLSLFVRLAETSSDPAWAKAADQTFLTFQPGEQGSESPEGPWFAHVDSGGCLWFEEYVGSVEPTQVVNGHIYAMYGVADYFRLTQDPTAAELFDGAATTVVQSFATYRAPGDVSYYCAAQYCKDAEWQPGSYHRGVVRQLETLSLMTSDRTFLDRANILRSDYLDSGSED